MRIEIVSIGHELLLGLISNTNAAFLSRELSQRGYLVLRHTVVSDHKPEIRHALSEALQRASCVIATGGLGPTLDDQTRSAAEELFLGESKELPNGVGLAPGVFYPSEGRGLFLLPGVPREMQPMFFHAVLPWIEQHAVPKKKFSQKCSLCLFKEVDIDPLLRTLQRDHPDIEIGIYPAQGTLQIIFRSDHPIEAVLQRFEEQFATYVFHEKTIEEAVHQQLIQQKQTLGLAESCTGGALAARLTALSDASYYLQGSIIAYANTWKEHFLHVPSQVLSEYGAVSREAIVAMLEGIFTETDVDFAIAISGVAGPKGGTVAHPVGTIYIGIGKRGERADIGLIHAPKDRLSAIDLAVQTALSALWRRLVHDLPTFS